MNEILAEVEEERCKRCLNFAVLKGGLCSDCLEVRVLELEVESEKYNPDIPEDYIKLEVETEECPHCGSQKIKLATPNDDTAYEVFTVRCLSCFGSFLVVPTQGEYFTLRPPVIRLGIERSD